MSPRSILRATLLCALSVHLLVASKARAQVPDSISFQGRLTNPSGVAVDTTIPVTLRLYKGGTEVWSSTIPSVAVDSGAFTVVLGGSGLETVAFNESMALGITLGSDPEIVPRTPLYASPYALAVRGFWAVPASDGVTDAMNVVGGSPDNYVAPSLAGATISGGGGWLDPGVLLDSVLASWGTVGGGSANTAGAWASTVSGGDQNKARGNYSSVSGGNDNRSAGSYAAIGGGRSNETMASYGTVAGGAFNQAGGGAAAVGGGVSNVAGGTLAAIPGGIENRANGVTSFAAGYKAKALHDGTFVWNDRSIMTDDDSLVSTGNNQFLIRADGGVGIGTAEPSSQLTVHGNLEIDSAGAVLIFPDGSTQTTAALPDGSSWAVTGNAGTTPGTHFLGTTDSTAFEIAVHGERALRIEPSFDQLYGTVPNVIFGHEFNYATSGAYGATISGGGGSIIRNRVGARYGTVGGGGANEANGEYSTVAGGGTNKASGHISSVIGGGYNVASADWSTVAGGVYNQARGIGSFAAGTTARAAHDGSFVWSDYSLGDDDSLLTTGPNQFVARAAGGFYFYTGQSSGATLAAGTGSWASFSDVNAKTDFNPVRRSDVLERLIGVPIRTWRYKDQSESITHMGPTAQDFYEAFGLGIDDKHIVTIDADGVSFAAIQGLYELVKEQQDEMARLQAEIERMRAAMKAAGIE